MCAAVAPVAPAPTLVIFLLITPLVSFPARRGGGATPRKGEPLGSPESPSPFRRKCSRRNRGFQFLDHGVRDLARTDGRRVVATRLHVVGDALAFADHGGDRALETVGRAALVEVAEHEDARQH